MGDVSTPPDEVLARARAIFERLRQGDGAPPPVPQRGEEDPSGEAAISDDAGAPAIAGVEAGNALGEDAEPQAAPESEREAELHAEADSHFDAGPGPEPDGAAVHAEVSEQT